MCVNIVFNVILIMGLSIDVYLDGVFYVYINISNIELLVIEFCDKLLDIYYVVFIFGNDFGEYNVS